MARIELWQLEEYLKEENLRLEVHFMKQSVMTTSAKTVLKDHIMTSGNNMVDNSG